MTKTRAASSSVNYARQLITCRRKNSRRTPPPRMLLQKRQRRRRRVRVMLAMLSCLALLRSRPRTPVLVIKQWMRARRCPCVCVCIDRKIDRFTDTQTHTCTTKSTLAGSLRNACMPAPRTAAYTARRIFRGEKLAMYVCMYHTYVCIIRMYFEKLATYVCMYALFN